MLMYRIKSVTDYNEFLELEEPWNKLLAESGIDNPYLRFEWFRIAFDFFEKESQLSILIVEEEAKMVAILPLVKVVEYHFGFRIKKLRFLTNVYTPFQDLIVADENSAALECILDHLKKNRSMWDLLEFKESRIQEQRYDHFIASCRKRGLFYHQFYLSRSWCVATDIPWENHLERIPAKTQKEFRRKIKRAENLGSLALVPITEYAEMKRHLDLFFEFYKHTWKGEELAADFYYEIAKAFSRKGHVVLYCLNIGGRPVAYMYGLCLHSILFGLKTTYDPAYYAYAPGIILFYRILESLFGESRISCFDIGRGEERYKQEMASVPVHQYNILCGDRSKPVPFVCHLRYALSTALKKNSSYNTLVKGFYTVKDSLSQMANQRAAAFTSSFRHSKETIFYKTLDGARAGNEEEGLVCRKAEESDLDLLAVAMQSRNLKELGERLQRELCYLVWRDGVLVSYFWLSREPDASGLLSLRETDLALLEFGTLAATGDGLDTRRVFEQIGDTLGQTNYTTVFARLNGTVSMNEEALATLGFRKEKTVSTQRFFGLPIRRTRTFHENAEKPMLG